MRTTPLLEKHFVLITFVLAIVATFVVYAFQFNSPPIRSDGLGYYAYLPSIFIHGDIEMRGVISHYVDGELPDYWNGIGVYEPTGRYLNKYPVGTAAMELPFFLAAQALCLLTGVDVNDGFSVFHHALIGFAGIFYMTAGIWVLQKLLRRYFSKKATLLTLTAIVFGTNLFHYGTYDATFSHAFSFFLVASFLYIIPLWYEKTGWRRTLLLGLIMGLIVLVRPVNVVIWLAWPLYGLKFRELLAKPARKHLLLIAGIIFVVLLPQVVYWLAVTGQPVVFSYQGEYFNFFHPEVANVLFSARKGLFFWSPVLLLVIPGVYLCSKKLRVWLWPIIISSILHAYLVASWWAWFFGGGFGHRAFVDILPFFALALGAFYNRFENTKWRKVVIVLTLVLVLLTLLKMYQYWAGILPVDGVTLEQYVGTFFQLTK